MKKWIYPILLICMVQQSFAKDKPRVYLIPGLGSDYRIFSKIDFEEFDTVIIQRPMPFKHETMANYAHRLSLQIDTTQSFALIGVSFGGMLATEIAEQTKPAKTILISSAKNRFELPFQYRFQRVIPVYRIISKRFIKQSSFWIQPLVEPDSKQEKETFKAMLTDKDPLFLKRASAMIVRWNRTTNTKEIIHLHGDSDRTIPFKNIKDSIKIQGGSHMMTLTKASEINTIVLGILTFGD
jgi:pimeloyl-ACP methyl ester carboxylesterase